MNYPLKMEPLEQIILQRAVETYRELYQRLKISEITVKEFESEKRRIFGPLARHRDNVSKIEDYRKLLEHRSQSLTGKGYKSWIDEVVRHEEGHSTTALVWAQSQDIQIDSEFGVYLLTREYEWSGRPIVGWGDTSPPFKAILDTTTKKVVVTNLNPYADFPNLAEAIRYNREKFLEFHRAVYGRMPCGPDPE